MLDTVTNLSNNVIEKLNESGNRSIKAFEMIVNHTNTVSDHAKLLEQFINNITTKQK